MSTPSLHNDLNLDSIEFFSNLADYNTALIYSIARHDDRTTEDLLYNFQVSDYFAKRIMHREKLHHD